MIPPCIVFDLDDTLYLERDYVRSGFHCLEEWTRKHLGLKDFASKAWSLFEEGERGHVFDKVLTQAGIPPEKSLIGMMIAIYREHKPNICLPADAVSCLGHLAGRTALALVSDGHSVSQRNKIQALGLRQYFDVIILTSELGEGFAKPHPRAFMKVQETLGNSTRRYIYVADNPIKDFAGPHTLGWQTIRMRRFGGLYSSVESGEFAATDLELSNLNPLTDMILGESKPHDIP